MGQKNKQRHQTKRKRASANLLNPLICRAKTTNTKRAKTSIKKIYHNAKQELISKGKIIKGLYKQQKRKCAHKKSLKSRKRRRQQPAEKQEM